MKAGTISSVTCRDLSPPGSSAHEEERVLKPTRGWAALDLRALWRYHELIYFLTWRDIKVRYKQTALGAAWAIIQPLGNVLFFTLIFGRLANLPSDGIPYPVFTLAALVPWTYFAYVLQQSGNSLIGNANLISKVFFPRLALVGAPALAGLLDLSIALGLLGGLMAVYHLRPGFQIVFLPVFVLFAVVISLAVGLWLAALSATYRDVKYALPFLTQMWLYASPVAYSATLVKGKLAILYAVNPMTGVIDGFRWALFGIGTSPGPRSVPSVAVTVLLLVGGLFYFRRVERTFADVV